MAVSIHERFENHIDTASPETSGDAKRETDTEEDPYDKGFEEKLTLARIKGAEQQDSGIEKNEEDDSPQKRRISTFSRETKNYTMNSHATIEGIRDRYDENGKKWFDSVLDSGVGGIDGWKVRLKGAGERYFMTSDSSSENDPNSKASGNFLSKEHPGGTRKERTENLQLPPENDGGKATTVESTKAAVIMESKVAPQKDWAEKGGYEAKEGIKQTFTPTHDLKGAIHAGIYKEVSSEENDVKEDIAPSEGKQIEQESERYVSYNDRFCYTPIEGDRGKWEGDRAESKFVPSETTEAGRAAKEKLQEYGLDGITYKDAEPDFSKCSEATVTIDHMTDDRMENNFPKADANCAEQWNIEKKDGRINWDAADVRDWRRENNCSWHECCDTRTMMLVPTEIHGYFRHSGGVAECKARDNADVGGGFDE